jgi:hypothetical protein
MLKLGDATMTVSGLNILQNSSLKVMKMILWMMMLGMITVNPKFEMGSVL